MKERGIPRSTRQVKGLYQSMVALEGLRRQMHGLPSESVVPVLYAAGVRTAAFAQGREGRISVPRHVLAEASQAAQRQAELLIDSGVSFFLDDGEIA